MTTPSGLIVAVEPPAEPTAPQPEPEPLTNEPGTGFYL